MRHDGPILSIRGVTKTFPGQVAVDDVSLAIAAGEVHALCGQNGSGKSTLIKVLSGFHEPDPGADIAFLGHQLVHARHEAQDARQRMHFIHQELGLIDTLDTAENMALGVAYDGWALKPVRRKQAYREARRRLAGLGMDIDVRAPVGTLPPVARAMIAIARATQGWDDGAGLLVLDEPTVSLPRAEVTRLFDAIRLLRDRGAGVLYVSHRLDEVAEIADRVSVLRDGKLVATRRVDEWTHADLVDEIVGHPIEARSIARTNGRRETVLSIRGLRAGELQEVSFDLAAGEVVGVTGLLGSGAEQLPEVLFGARPLEAGTIAVERREVRRLDPSRAMALGMALVPADRAVKGCILTHSVRENMTLADLRPVRGPLGLSNARERREVARWAARVQLQRGDAERAISRLSGGNQQKVVIARWLRTQPRVLLLHEPTQGVDVGAKTAIYGLVREATSSGTAALIVSTDTEDLAQIADRVLVLDRGRIVAELAGEHLSSRELTKRMLAGTAA